MSYYLAVIGTMDNPIYELEFGTFKQQNNGKSLLNQKQLELIPFIINSSLDLIEDLQWKFNKNYFKNYDNFNNNFYKLSCYLTFGNMKLILLHQLDDNLKNDDNIKQFLFEINELYVKTMLNPFYNVNEKIKSEAFDLKVKAVARKYL
ncbi:hypothetical protein PACTADRAFT_1217 [Pachysolen tannophilus NRRL Y-2460]|uniref:Trafficking protein particle complex subunit n=1 Tax=Pachysolen tannophilus NRRL Y-2460 TaxID=669874 RepID=A0A1E4TY87_PACTA|nr:hypothetical protein PACTADRAFT_1217 [Pachysolen tannophilus NRRL Y-2460]